MKFLRVNMTRKTVETEEAAPQYQELGGRGLTSTLVNNEVPADCLPLGPDNKLVFAPGLLSGYSLINTSRLSIGAKSPLTGGIKESNVGGTISVDLKHAGLAAVIVEGQAPQGECYLLKIDANGQGELVDATEYKGVRTYALAASLKEKYGRKNSVTCIGPAGEFQLSAASIQTTDMDGRPCRAAGRGGLGAVMGSKGLKALVVSREGKAPSDVVDQAAFNEASKAYAKAVKEDEFSGETLAEFGSAVLVGPINAAGAFPTHNATKGVFESWEKISGEALAETIEKRGGKKAHMGCAQCIIHCSNEYVDQQGQYVTSSLEYETIWSMGGMTEIDDLDAIARLDFLCDDIGLDTISTGVAVGVAMDAGYRPFGDAQAAIEMVEEVARGTAFGRILGSGPQAVGLHFGHDRVPVVKGQSMAAYDPRAIQGMAVTYATTPMGGDHTAGWVVDQNLADFGGTLNPHGTEGQVEASRNTQIHMAVVDTIGLCDFAQSGFAADNGPDNVYQMVGSRLGRPFTEDDWTNLGKKIIKAELGFNRRAGLTNEDDRLPKMFYEEPLPPHNKVVLFTAEELDQTFADLKDD